MRPPPPTSASCNPACRGNSSQATPETAYGACRRGHRRARTCRTTNPGRMCRGRLATVCGRPVG
eukprot:2041955-Lingulodinium_polyedra.AAC.1